MDATRQEGLRRLDAFTADGVQRYGKTRNFDFGPLDRSNVSVLSPYIRHRLLLEEEVIAGTLARHPANAVRKFIEEVFWRAYFKGYLQHHPTIWAAYRADVRKTVQNMETDADLRERYISATEGNTGIDCFDAWAKELVATGYLHNHARMWFASIWVFTLRLPWQMGADFFLRHLLDGDPASNTLSWRWVSGLHTKGKTYLARVSNIANFTDGRFNPQGMLATEATALEEERAHPTLDLSLPKTGSFGDRFGLLMTEDDLSADDILDGEKPAAVLGIAAPRTRSVLPIGTHAHSFATSAVRNAVDATADSLAVDGRYTEADSWTATLVEWATQHHLDTIVTSYIPVGPVYDALSDAKDSLSDFGIRIVQVGRRYDRETWPFADRGYFKLKKKIDTILERLDLDGSDVPFASSSSAPLQIDFLNERG